MRGLGVLAGMICAGLMSSPSQAIELGNECAGLATPEGRPVAHRGLAAEDLIDLRDIGEPGPSPAGAVLSLSPDGTRVAFQMRRTNADRTGYCVGLYVLALERGARAKLVDLDRGLVMDRLNYRGVEAPGQFPKVIVPVWAPDGRSIAHLKTIGNLAQVWGAMADGGRAEQLTHAEADVERYAWSEDGRALIFTARPQVAAARREIDGEGRSGFVFDDRFLPMESAMPYPRAQAEKAFALNLATGEVAGAALETLGQTDHGPTAPKDARKWAVSPTGRLAWTVGALPRGSSKEHLFASLPGKGEVVCARAECVGRFDGVWWDDRSGEVVFIRREGWADSRQGLYRWNPRTQALARLFSTDNFLIGCTPTAAGALICAEEGSLLPRRLVSVDIRSGRTTVIFDPNPEFAVLRLGASRRLHWTNIFGIASFGDLVLPPGHRAGLTHPLVVVTYNSRGFLRGGTGDEYPVQLLAARGYAVLSVTRPMDFADQVPGVRTNTDFTRANLAGWADRRSVQSSIELGVAEAVKTGAIDQTRMGIAGLSDGASAVRFALINSSMFSAAAIGTCCGDATTQMTLFGPASAAQFLKAGYPPLGRANDEFWAPASLAVARPVSKTPLLMQLSEREYRLALETFTVLRQNGAPVEMFVFPGEGHIKLDPQHRLAVYLRNLDWFDFWLRGLETSERPAETARWRMLRAERDTAQAQR